MTDNVTARPWVVSTAFCGEHQTETTSIYHYPREYCCIEVLETGCECGDEAVSAADAAHIVKCVNAHERLVEALRKSALALKWYNDTAQREECDAIKILLEELNGEQE